MAHIKTIKQSTINRALRLHKEWLETQGEKGEKLIVTNDIIKNIDFKVVRDFTKANFSYVDFSKLRLSEIDFLD